MGTHPIFESDFDCLTEIRTKMTEQETPTVTETPTVVTTEAPAMETEAVAPPQLTVDMGPEKLDRVPEHLLKRRKQYQGMKRKEKEEARQRKKIKATPTIQFKRAEHFLRAAKLSSRDSIRMDRNLRKLITSKDRSKMVPVENVKLIAVVRIRTADGIGKLAIAAMRKLRVMKMYECALMRYNDKTHRLLKACEPYVTWGAPDVRVIRELITKRGHAMKKEKKVVLNSNAAVEEAFGDVNMLAIEDLISELVTVGPHFDKIQSFLAPFQLASAGGTMKKKDQMISFAKGGVNGDRGEKINELLRKMT